MAAYNGAGGVDTGDSETDDVIVELGDLFCAGGDK